MAILHLHLAFTLTVISLVSTPTSCKLVESLVSTRENFLLKGHVMQRQRTSNSFSCAHLCSKREGCRSYNFKHSKKKGLCELSSETAGYFDDGLTREAGWLYGQIVRIRKENSAESNKPGKKCTSLKYWGRSGKTFAVFVHSLRARTAREQTRAELALFKTSSGLGRNI